jgi:hypothetical protein
MKITIPLVVGAVLVLGAMAAAPHLGTVGATEVAAPAAAAANAYVATVEGMT